ncbi:MAG: radical SAM protein [Bdellovibrionota bacterium]
MKTSEKIIHTYTFGCKVNWYDTSSIERLLEKDGHGKVDDSQSMTPDTVVINSCTVTNAADKQARQLIRKVSRQHPNAKIVVTGCYAQSKPEEIKQMQGVAHVVKINDQYKLPQMLGWNDEVKEEFLPVYSKRTRANLKLQNGCNAYCSFCILPYIRGRSSSIPLDHIIEQAKFYEAQGHHEIVLTGTHVRMGPRPQSSSQILRGRPGDFGCCSKHESSHQLPGTNHADTGFDQGRSQQPAHSTSFPYSASKWKR